MNKDSISVFRTKGELIKAVEKMSRPELEKILKNFIEDIFSVAATVSTTVGTLSDSTAVTENARGIKAQEEDKFSEKRVTELILELGIPASLKGYKYLKCAIPYYAKSKGKCSITKDLYPTVAKMNATTSSRVERAIKHSVDVAFDRADMKLLNKLFGNSVSASCGRATNSGFIAGIVEYLKQS